MEKFFNTILMLLFFCFLQSCDYYQKQIGENYFIRWVNTRESMDIGFGMKDGSEGLIKETVFEVHWNDEYIIAKRHPRDGTGDDGINRSITEYYILKKVKFGEAKASQNMFGPLIKEEYKSKKAELGLIESEMESLFFDDLK
jgi:hypothetical protein